MALAVSEMRSGTDQTIKRIRANDLPALLDQIPSTIDTLSLDCFDTLIWRNYAAPRDVFYQLQHTAAFQSVGMTASLRIQAEAKARRLMLLNREHSEVRLHDIYRFHQPEADQILLDALTQEELGAEMQACFAYPPLIQLIRTAHERGMKIIIVSDTYFDEPLLRRLLAAALPADVFAAIDAVYCSCDLEQSKAAGLFKKILKSRRNQPENYLHIGDHVTADFTAPRELNLYALHFQREDEQVTNMLRLQAISACVMDPGTRSAHPLPSPFQGIFALEKTYDYKPESFIGFASLGPVMYTFARYLQSEILDIRRQGRQPKVLFLMRDAHLPFLACAALDPTISGTCVSISRFTACAAAFRSECDIEKYLAESLPSLRFDDMARQLQLPQKVAEPLIRSAQKSARPEAEFARLIRRRDILRIILEKSAEFRTRLLRYLQKQAGITTGDTLVFVDLGYHGSVQDLLTPVLAEINIEITGRYLITLPTPGWESRRRGLLDASWCDDKALQTLVSNIALLEQLCTSSEGSVIDYDRHGNAVHADSAINQKQHEKLSRIQAECQRFVQNAHPYFQSLTSPISLSLLRETVRAELCRMIFFPTEVELQYLRQFQFDLNLGTKDVLTVFDPEQGIAGLHRRGIFFIEKNTRNMRMNYPAELRAAGFELTLALLTQQRLGLDIKLKDMLPRQAQLKAVLTRGREIHHTLLDAQMTYDGYYSAWTPAGCGDFQISLLWGNHYEWLQLESAELIEMSAFISQSESLHTLDVWPHLSFAQMTEHHGRLFNCHTAASSMTLTPPPLESGQYIFRFVYRPIAARVAEAPKAVQGPKITFTF